MPALAPHIELIVRAHDFCSKPSPVTQGRLVAALEAAAGVDIPELYNPLFAACLGAKKAAPREWRGVIDSIDSEIRTIGATLRAGGWFKRKDIAA